MATTTPLRCAQRNDAESERLWVGVDGGELLSAILPLEDYTRHTTTVTHTQCARPAWPARCRAVVFTPHWPFDFRAFIHAT
eukprot:7343351-Prymnesium_polylepis.1